MNFTVTATGITVTEDVDGAIVKRGSCSDSCCNTNVIVKGVVQPVVFENEPGKGGFIAKKLYVLELINAFKIVYKNENVKAYLNKFPIVIKKSELVDGSYLTKLEQWPK